MSAATLPERGCGSHTATLVPDVANGAVYVYNSASSGLCPGIDIVKIPLGNTDAAAFQPRAATGRSCHDTGVILGTAMLAGCAGGNGFTVLSLGGPAAARADRPPHTTSQWDVTRIRWSRLREWPRSRRRDSG